MTKYDKKEQSISNSLILYQKLEAINTLRKEIIIFSIILLMLGLGMGIQFAK